jgi:hypothetical protein
MLNMMKLESEKNGGKIFQQIIIENIGKKSHHNMMCVCAQERDY